MRLSNLTTLACLLAVLLVPAAAAQDAARLAPADAKLFIQADNLGDWLTDWEKDPLYRYLQENMGEREPGKVMKALEAAMGMDSHDIFRTYFGKRIVLIGEHAGDKPPTVMLSQVTKKDADFAIDSLKLSPVDEMGTFKLYAPDDASVYIGFSDGWMLLADPRHKAYMKSVLTIAADAERLADNATFSAWMKRLPADRAVSLYAHKADNDIHAIGVTKSLRLWTVSYAGKFPDLPKLLKKVGDAKALQFGPLPNSTISAATFNILDDEPDPKALRFLDGLLATQGKTWKADVLTKLDAPGVVFLGEVPSTAVSPEPGFAVPVVGFAMHMKDTSVAADLNTMLGNLVALGNIATMAWGTGPMAIKADSFKDVTYVTVDAGAVLAARAGKPELAGTLKVSYGRIGDWYVLTTHDDYFRQCIAADQDPARALKIAPAIPLDDAAAPVMAGFTRMPLLAAHVDTWVEYIRKVQPGLLEEGSTSRQGKAVRHLQRVAGMLEFYNHVTLQFEQGDDSSLTGTLKIQRN